MIEIKNLTKKFGNTTVLDNISLSVNKGEVLGLLGPNGAGKTTTMKILTSYWIPTSGSVVIDNIDVAENSLESRRKIGYLPENVPLYEDALVIEYLKIIAQIRGIEKSELSKRISEVAEVCGLSKVLRRPIDELSKGYRQRVGLAQAIIHNPEVLILDEPTTGLDPNQIVEIRELIKRIGQEKTVIFSTHILSEVSATCDRVVIINNGKIVKEGTPDDLAKISGVGESIYIKIKGFKEEVLNKLNQVERIKEVKIVDRESERIIGYEVIPVEGADIREYLSVLIIHSGWAILEMTPKKNTLENVFRELTK